MACVWKCNMMEMTVIEVINVIYFLLRFLSLLIYCIAWQAQNETHYRSVVTCFSEAINKLAAIKNALHPYAVSFWAQQVITQMTFVRMYWKENAFRFFMFLFSKYFNQENSNDFHCQACIKCKLMKALGAQILTSIYSEIDVNSN